MIKNNAYVLSLLLISFTIISMDQPFEQRKLLKISPHQTTNNLLYIGREGRDVANNIGIKSSQHDPFIVVMIEEEYPSQKRDAIINPGQRKMGLFPVKNFFNTSDNDISAGGLMIDKGFTQYRERCLNNFRQRPRIEPGCEQEFLDAGIVNPDGSHGSQSFYAMAHLDMPTKAHFDVSTVEKKMNNNRQIN